jgi:hypothetical protein
MQENTRGHGIDPVLIFLAVVLTIAQLLAGPMGLIFLHIFTAQ